MKIDTSKIDGFDKMSADEKLKAIFELEEDNSSTEEMARLKRAVDKATSEAADYKRQLRAKQTDDEANKAAAEEKQRELTEKYEALLRESNLSKHAAKFKSLGFGDSEAAEAAEALLDGDFDKVFAATAKAKTEFERTIRADVVKNSTPRPEQGSGGKTQMTKEEILKIKDVAARQRAIADNIELFTKE